MVIRKRIAIVGAGVSGLCAAKHMLAAKGDVELIPVIFDQKNAIGGAWVYEDVVEGRELTSGIYKHLMTNLPKQVMLFPDFPFGNDLPSFMHHTVVRDYIQSYAQHFQVNKHVRFNTKVVDIEPILHDEQCDKWVGTRWRVTLKDVNTEATSKEEFDGVAICNGHFTKPYIPVLEGIENFQKIALHSNLFRDPDDFEGKTILILGFGPSGRDICSDLSKKCPRIYVSNNHKCDNPLLSDNIIQFPDNIIQFPMVDHVNEDGLFVFEDDSVADVDVLIYCTGYQYDLSFLNEKVGLKVQDNQVVHGLYKHLVYMENPSLCLIGLPLYATLLPLVHQQSAYIVAMFCGKIKLPSKVEMQKDTERYIEEFSLEKIPNRYFHSLITKQWHYNEMLASLSGCEKNSPMIQKVYDHVVFKLIPENPLLNYRDVEFVETGDDDFVVK